MYCNLAFEIPCILHTSNTNYLNNGYDNDIVDTRIALTYQNQRVTKKIDRQLFILPS